MFGTVQDITERKQMEEEIISSKDKLHSLIQNIQAGVIVHGPDTKIKSCNKVSLKLLGLTEDQMIGKKAINKSWKFFSEGNSDLQLEDYPVNRVLKSKTEINNMILGIYRPKTNDIVYALVNAVPELTNKGEIAEVIVTLTDVTDRIQIEKERENLLNSLKKALDEIKSLKGIVPICSHCKKIRDDKGFWNQLELYIEKHSDASFSHGMCPGCMDEVYGKEDWYINSKKNKPL